MFHPLLTLKKNNICAHFHPSRAEENNKKLLKIKK
jgi:hypothetical protein